VIKKIQELTSEWKSHRYNSRVRIQKYVLKSASMIQKYALKNVNAIRKYIRNPLTLLGIKI